MTITTLHHPHRLRFPFTGASATRTHTRHPRQPVPLHHAGRWCPMVRTQCGMTTITVDHEGVARRTICRRHVVEVITATARFTYCPRCDQAPPPDR